MPLRPWSDIASAWLIRLLLLFLAGLPAAPARAANEPAADVVYLNRIVYTMRVPLAGSSPAARASRVVGRLSAVPVERLRLPIELMEVVRDGDRGIALRLGDETLLTVRALDLDPDTDATLDEVAARSARQLAEAFDARVRMSQPEVLLRGVAISAAGLPVVLLGAWLAARLLATLRRRLQRLVAEEAATQRVFGVYWSAFGLRAVAGVVRVLSLAGVAALVVLWVGHTLRQFPATQPLAAEMRAWLLGSLWQLLAGLWAALPNITTIVLIVLIARGVVGALNQLFGRVGSGRLRIPGIHPETARATRRLAVFGVWGLAVAAAYPYIPGSDSAVFRGLSVFLGFMFTLGSTGVVSQWMQGLVIVYSRALRPGDFVRIGEHEGVVQELGALSIKVADYRGNEVTLPNSSVVAGSIVNHSRLAEPGAVRAAVRVSIGYDVPWRQVHELLLQAAARTPGVRGSPSPRVFQRALSDFYIEYELVVEIAGARLRAQAVTSLHEHIQDVFTAAGVAILSPHYVAHTPASAAPSPTEAT